MNSKVKKTLPNQVLLVDPDKAFSQEVLENWSLHSVPLLAINSPSELFGVLKQEFYQTIFLSIECLNIDRLDTISYIREHQQAGTEVVVLAQPQQIQLAEEAIRRGARSYLLKPVDVETLHEIVRYNINRQRNLSDYRLMEDQVLEDMLGSTPAMKKILTTLNKVAKTNSTILLTGETGTGKEFIAKIVHRLSKRVEEPFIVVNCGAIPENLVESELFGHKKGAFTGAIADKKGLFEEADRGTLFLDEIGELPLKMQVKLLRFLEDRKVQRVGSTESKEINVRIIAATNRNLQAAVKSDPPSFREDLFFRLNTFQIHLPPLRERMDTLPSLVKHFIIKHTRGEEKEIKSIEPEAILALSRYDYPGNIRELSSIIEHAIVMSDDGVIRLCNLPEPLSNPAQTIALPASSGGAELLETIPSALETGSSPTDHTVQLDQHNEVLSLAELERRHILLALQHLGNNQSEVARQLGISRSTLWRKLQEYKIKLD